MSSNKIPYTIQNQLSRWMGSIAGLLLILLLTHVHANAMQSQQQQTQGDDTLAQLVAAQENADVEMRITMKIHDMNLADALEVLAEKIRVGISYNSDVMPDKKVTLDMANAPVFEVLYKMLEDTNLEPVIPSTRDVIVIREKEKVENIDLYQVTVTGTVVDAQTGEALPGVSILVEGIEGTSTGTTTNLNGEFELQLPNLEATLILTYIGYQRMVVNLDGITELYIELTSQVISGEELVVVGYATRTRETLSGSVSSVGGDVLERAPISNLSNALSGQVPGLVTVNPTGEPGRDGANIFIRGLATLGDNKPLIVIDGVPNRSGGLDRLNPRDIENISVLKDASAAIYGAQAANGVILITTKRGEAGVTRINVDFNQGFNQPTRVPEMADAATYLRMLNEIDIYRDRPPNFSEERIRCHELQEDPWRCPDTDWFSETLKPVSMQSRGYVSVTGGSESVRYFISGGALTEDGFYRNSATRYNQFDFRSNLDSDISQNISVSLDISGRFEDRNFPTVNTGETFRMLIRGKPNEHAFFPNGKPAPDIEEGVNPVVTGTPATGFDEDERYFFQSNLGVNIDIPGIEGLSLRGNFSYDRNTLTRRLWETPWTLYTANFQNLNDNGEPTLNPLPRGPNEPRLTQRHSDGFDVLANLLVNYQHDFENHTLGILLGTEYQSFENRFLEGFRRDFASPQISQMFAGSTVQQSTTGDASEGVRQNFFTRINYDYQSKYLIEFVGRYDGSYIFPEDNRFGFFPGVSAAWRLTQEDWFRNLTGFFDELKLRASYGFTGNDRIEEFQFLEAFGFGSGFTFADEIGNSISQLRVPNQDVTWEVARQFDVGFDGSILNNRLSFEVDYFDYLRSDILWWRSASVPATTGFNLPRENIGEVASWGVDGSIGYRAHINSDLLIDISINGAWGKNKIIFWDEAPGSPPWQRSTGFPMDTNLFYNATGIFQTEEEIENTPSWPGARTGDIIFEDVNGDGIIDGRDRIRINKNEIPRFTGGLNLGVMFRNFDFNALFQGAEGAVQYIVTKRAGEFGNFFREFADNRWTPDNPSTTHPRTFSRQDEYWIANNNTFFLRDADYIRLKNLEIGYRLPASVLDRVGIQNFRIYASGHNLITWDTLKIADPETRDSETSVYPQKRTVNFGVSLSF